MKNNFLPTKNEINNHFKNKNMKKYKITGFVLIKGFLSFTIEANNKEDAIFIAKNKGMFKITSSAELNNHCL